MTRQLLLRCREGQGVAGASVVSLFFSACLASSPGVRTNGADSYRRGVALWSLACYRSLINKDSLDPKVVRSVIELLKEALHNAPELKESLATENLDRDLAPLLGNSVFEQWRTEVLTKRGDI